MIFDVQNCEPNTWENIYDFVGFCFMHAADGSAFGRL